jgi:hypothetical protein
LRDALPILVPYAVEIRLPDDWFMPAKQDAEEARRAAGAVLHRLEKVLPEVLGGPPHA